MIMKLQSILILLILFLYLTMWLSASGKSWETSEGIQECNFYQNHGTSKNLENQLKDQPKEPTKAMGKWLRESLDILQERLERELRVLEQQVKDLEEWLDYHLKDLGSEEKCGTITSHF
ncbi:small integral membrane protein 23 isoform X2 [Sminthopsis crassicaudata]|uniref:Small integral membrane protein 23 n=1 Tax=Sarcophilus harrisii TaxID=9305 RepID=A0A7N4PZ28_SARHA|nr:small integral membrane protein 23 isoform X2 [Sarcophilus harrisii]XP_031809519.1 small integral membrane protein 23 isoform X2 [Sarcophilus harrisii]XP_051829707.1 small integral membrane protein 23 isoform X2 [Antechinus flavipes]